MIATYGNGYGQVSEVTKVTQRSDHDSNLWQWLWTSE